MLPVSGPWNNVKKAVGIGSEATENWVAKKREVERQKGEIQRKIDAENKKIEEVNKRVEAERTKIRSRKAPHESRIEQIDHELTRDR